MNAPIMPESVRFILKKLKENGHESYIVGGCVRDSIMGIMPHDWDITTSATPFEVKDIFPHTFDTGIKHGTVTVVIERENYEITTYRVEGEYEDFRHPSNVSFTRDLHEDLLRRDFTMNAIAYCEEEGYVDIFGGICDIKNKLIRGVGCAEQRFKEDALRMLRAVRFSVQLDFEIERKTLLALKKNYGLIKNISSERIREELTKTLLGEFSHRINMLWESKLLMVISKGVWESCVENEEKLIKTIKMLPKEAALRYAGFLMESQREHRLLFINSLKFDNKTKKLIEKILENINVQINSNIVCVRKFASKEGVEAARGVYEIKIAQGDKESEKALNNLKTIIEENQCISVKQLAITGSDIIKIGFKKGEIIGEILEELLEKVIENPKLNTIESLSELSRQIKADRLV